MSSDAPINPENDPNHSRNFVLLIVYQCWLRIGWIFKTESIIMPAVLDVIGGSAWLRGCLPMLNRLGQSVPPLLASDRIRNTRQKQKVLACSTAVMGGAFFTLALVWYVTGGKASWYLPLIFLIVYAIFFTATGINMLVFNTLTGKLVKANQRGQLSLYGTVIGASLAALCAYWLLNLWLSSDRATADESRFDLVFAFTGAMFTSAAGLTFAFRERSDTFNESRRSGFQLVTASAKSVLADRNFLLLAIIAGLFGMSLTLFPHYQRLGRDRFELSMTALIPWVIAQNLGAAAFSVPSGWIADRLGTRIVLRWMLLTMCVAPILAIVLAQYQLAGWGWFTLVFCLLGLTPVTMRFFNYYTLEITGRENHPQYLSTMSIAMAVPPVLLSIPMGALVEIISFEFVFILVTICIFIGWILTFFLIEPRHADGTKGKTV